MAPELKAGLLAAAAMSAWTLGQYALGWHTSHMAIGYYTSGGLEAILVLVLWRMLRAQLHQANRTWLPVWEGLLRGLLAGLVAAMGFYIFLSIYVNKINPDFADLMLEWRIGEQRAASLPEEQIRALARGFRWSMTPTGLAATIARTCLLVAFFASPLLTLWLNWRRKEPVGPG